MCCSFEIYPAFFIKCMGFYPDNFVNCFLSGVFYEVQMLLSGFVVQRHPSYCLKVACVLVQRQQDDLEESSKTTGMYMHSFEAPGKRTELIGCKTSKTS